jgi:hypothetical protein
MDRSDLNVELRFPQAVVDALNSPEARKAMAEYEAERIHNEASDQNEILGAASSGNLGRMLRASELDGDLIDRHYLWGHIVAFCYGERTNPTIRRIGINYGQLHLSNLESILSEFRRMEPNDDLPQIPSLRVLIAMLNDELRFDEAIAVCDEAIRLGLIDGTKAGYAGRRRLCKNKKNRIK